MPRPKTLPIALTTTAVLAALTLTACGSGGAGSGEMPTGDGSDPDVQPFTYDFTQPTVQSDQQIVIEVDQNLIDVNDDYAKNRYIERVTVRPLEIDSSEWCAMTWDYELLGDPIAARYDKLKEDNIDWMTADIGDDQWREAAKSHDPNLSEKELDSIVSGEPLELSDEEARQAAEDYNMTVEEVRELAAKTPPKYSHDELREIQAASDPVLSDEELHQMAVRDTLSVTNPELGEPDLGDPSRGFYYSEDDNVATVIDRCAASVNVDETDFEISFSSDDGYLGEVPIGVMRDGTVFATDGEVSGWQLDSNGDWIKD